MQDIDIKENYIMNEYPGVLEILLKDRTTSKNIIWATDNYSNRGKDYYKEKQIKPKFITGYSGRIIKPRISKSQIEQKRRSKDMAEVFTPAWMCNKQNNLIDDQWFAKKGIFNEEKNMSWKKSKKVKFIQKTWEEYIDEERIEITCGEAPYLTSRYDAVYGGFIEPMNRIGLFDRKLRVVSENVLDKEEWIKYATIACKRIYGYDFQGDNVLVSRENLLLTFEDFYFEQFKEKPSLDVMLEIANILSWNIWQMDGLKYVVPNSCHKETQRQISLFSEQNETTEICNGCKNGNVKEHNGQYCYIMDWKENSKIRFVDLIK